MHGSLRDDCGWSRVKLPEWNRWPPCRPLRNEVTFTPENVRSLEHVLTKKSKCYLSSTARNRGQMLASSGKGDSKECHLFCVCAEVKEEKLTLIMDILKPMSLSKLC
uniref:Uncharacterized protein n=1 Tax=Knipowitschia caucasica TaxID=637954 RepID=A0AAV2JE05_KNICA